MRGLRRSITLCATLLTACALAPSAASAASDWSATSQELSPGGVSSEVPQVAIANDGSAVAVWRRLQPDANKLRLYAAYRSRGGNFSAPEVISFPPGQSPSNELGNVGKFRLDMNAAGQAVVAFEKLDAIDGGDREYSIRSVFKPAGGKFLVNSEQTVDTSPYGLTDPEVAIDGAGTSTVIYHGIPVGFNQNPLNRRSIYQSKTRPASGTWSSTAPNILDHDDQAGTEFDDYYNETDGSIDSDEAGNRLAAVTTQQFENGGSATVYRQEVHPARRAPSAPFWTDISGYDNSPAADQAADATEAAVGPGGGAIAWREGVSIFASHRDPPRTLNTSAISPPGRPTLGSDASSNMLAAWTQRGRLVAAFSPNGSGSAPFEPTDIDPVPGAAPTPVNRPRTDPRLSTGRSNEAGLIFEEACGSSPSAICPEGTRSDRQVVRAAVRPPGAKTKFDAPASLSGAVDLEADDGTKTETGPRIAINANGEGVAVWSQQGGPTNTDLIVHASLLVPRGITPAGVIPIPPPPPPPPAPIPSAIEVARRVESGDAVVLTAAVSGPVSSLVWSFGTKDEPKIVETAGANGQVPRSVRLRHPNRTFTARLTAVGPGGARSFARQITTPKPPDTSVAKRVLSRLNKTDAVGVFATGNASGLLGGACSAIKIYAGKQKVEGCFRPVEKIVDIPARERGAVKQLGDSLGLDENKKNLMDEATKLTDNYVSEGKALLNDKFPVTPSKSSSLVSMPQADTLFSAKAELPVGGASYNPSGGFDLKLDPKKATIPLGKLPKPPKLPSLAGLEIVGDWDVSLDKQEAKIKASVKLPPAITKAGVQISNQVNLRATPDRVIVDDVRVGPLDVNIASLKVDKFQIQYQRGPNQWDGQGKACLIGSACLDMVPPNGGVVIKNGDLERAGATLVFPQPGLPLFPGVNLERVGFGVGLRPTRIFGNARVGVAQIVKLDGRIFVAFPTTATPFVLNRNEVGGAYPANLYGQKFTKFTFGATAEALVDVPIIGETTLGNAYVLYEYPGYIAFGGGFQAKVLDLVGITGGVNAEADVPQGVFDVHGEIRACLYLADLDLCAGAVGHVSRGRGGTGGAGACVQLGPFSVGGGVRWNDLSDPYIWPIDGCKWSPFRVQVRQSAASARAKGKGPKASATQLVRGDASRAVLARESKVGVSQAGTYTIKVDKDKPAPVVRLDGVGTAPAIRVSGPGGVLEAPAGKGFVKTPDNKIRIMRYEGQLAKITSIGFQNAKPGTYTVQVLPGSSPVVRLQQATNPPDAKVKGKVTGTGRNRVLSYEVARRPSQKVVFSELTAGGAAKVIGSTSGGKGRIRFNSAPGYGRRSIIAQFNLDGISAERKRVTTFRALSPLLARPKGVKLSRAKGGSLRVSWSKVAGATRYEVAATPSSRRMVFATTRGRRATLRLHGWDAGRVTVRAVGDLREGKPAGRRFKAVEKRPSAFRSFPRCKVTKKKINCGKSKRVKVRAKAKKRRSRGKR